MSMVPDRFDTDSTTANAPNAASAAFGRVITAMVTPFDHAGRLDERGTERLAAWLTRDGWNDSVVVNGTTGESISTTDREKSRAIRAAKQGAAAHGGKVIAGVGAGSTAHSIKLAKEAASAGADGLLVVAPYYSCPGQTGLLRHLLAVADATKLPVMIYDIPKRTGIAIETETVLAAARHPRILAVKEAKGDLEGATEVMGQTHLAYYSGDDALNLPWLSVGATGFVSVVGHVVGDQLTQLLQHHVHGRNAEALALHRHLMPIFRGMFWAPGAASAKAALGDLGLPGGPVRLPLVDLTEEQRRELRHVLAGTVTEMGAPADPARVPTGWLPAEATVGQVGR